MAASSMTRFREPRLPERPRTGITRAGWSRNLAVRLPAADPGLIVARSGRLGGGSRLAQPGLTAEGAHLQDLHAEQLEPGQQAGQRRLGRQLTVYHGLHRFDRGGQILEVKQSLRRKDAGDTYLVGGCHPGPQSTRDGGARSLIVQRSSWLRPPHGGWLFIAEVTGREPRGERPSPRGPGRAGPGPRRPWPWRPGRPRAAGFR